jgi:hypothetical protein|tara:strand:- start:13545 stop:13814 length:270 start_codon:yes stop_codon:yes gene_type:complete
MAAAQTIQLAVTAVSGTHAAFSPVVDKVYMENVGANRIYFEVDATATTSHFFLEPGETFTLGVDGVANIHGICDATLTSTLQLTGVAQW